MPTVKFQVQYSLPKYLVVHTETSFIKMKKTELSKRAMQVNTDSF